MPNGSRVLLVALAALGLSVCARGRASAATGVPTAAPLAVPSWALAPAERLDAFAQGAVTSPAPTPPTHPVAAPVPGEGGGTPSPLSAAGRSLILPGWGQLATGHKTQAAIFGVLELGTWVAFGVYQREGNLRHDSYYETARLFAGIDLTDKGTKIEKLVGQFETNDVYNQYVVLREATYFYEDPAERAQYIASHTIGPEDAWSWTSFEAFERYRAERRSSEQAYQRVKYVLSFAVINRMVSAIAAAKQASSARARERALEGGTGALDAPLKPSASLAWELAPGKGFVPDARVACVLRF